MLTRRAIPPAQEETPPETRAGVLADGHGSGFVGARRAVARENLEFIEEDIKLHAHRRPNLATPNEVRLDLRTMVLRNYGKPGGLPTRYLGTPSDRIVRRTAPGGHISLFMGAHTLKR